MLKHFIAGIVLMTACFAAERVAFGEAMIDVSRDGDLEVRLRVSHLGITTADRVAVAIDARAPAGSVLQLPAIEGRLGDFRVRDSRTDQARMSADGAAVEQSAYWILEPYLPGKYAIPPLAVSSRPIAGGTGEARKIETPALTVDVASVLPQVGVGLKLRDLAPPVKDHGSWLPIVLLLILVPPCVASLLRLFRGADQDRRRAGVEPVPPPHEAALAELETIGRSAAGVEKLNDVFCRYVQLRFHQRTRGLSLEELSRGMNLNGSARFTYERLTEQLQRARYGREEIAERAAGNAHELLGEFVHQTTPGLRKPGI